MCILPNGVGTLNPVCLIRKTWVISMVQMKPQAEHRVAATLKGVQVPASPHLGAELRAALARGAYEAEEIAGALHVVRPGDRVLEMGAGLGIVGAVVGVCARPSRLVAYEANPALLEAIQAIYAINGLEGSHEVRNRLLMSAPDAPPSLPFHVHKSFLGSSLSDLGAYTKDTVEIETESFEQVQQDLRPDVLLVDIEGAERGFLRHADLRGVRAIVMEFHPEAYGRWGMLECKFRLYRAGFRPVRAHSHRTVWTCLKRPHPSA